MGAGGLGEVGADQPSAGDKIWMLHSLLSVLFEEMSVRLAVSLWLWLALLDFWVPTGAQVG